MSREDRVEAAAAVAEARRKDTEDVQLHVNVRLQLDEVTRAEAEHLRAQPKRAPTRRDLTQLACRIFDARRTRDRVLGPRLFGEPAWDILLALYCFPARGEMLSVTSLSHAANVPSTTGHRWQQLLISKGLIEHGPQGIDARRHLVRLTRVGKELLEEYLTQLFYCDTPAPPYPEHAGG